MFSKIKHNLIFIVFGAVLFFIALTSFFFLAINPPAKTPQPSPVDYLNGPQENTPYQEISKEDQEILDQDSLIGDLILKLPYEGQYFTFSYSFETNSFTLAFDQDNEDRANTEFDNFLKSNNIQDRSWFNDLRIESK